MKTALIILGTFFAIVLLVVVVFLGSVRGAYNRLVGERVGAQTAEAQVETQEQRRLDLLPNEATVAKAGLVHEEKVFENISKAQAAFTNAQTPAGRNDAGNQLGAALRGYLVVAQQYPQLRGLNSIETLSSEIEGTENRISVARQRYNESVQTYDQDLQSFPSNMVATHFHFQELPLFATTPEAKSAPNLKGNLGL